MICRTGFCGVHRQADGRVRVRLSGDTRAIAREHVHMYVGKYGEPEAGAHAGDMMLLYLVRCLL